MEITDLYRDALKNVKLVENVNKTSFNLSSLLSSKKQAHHLKDFNQKVRKLCQTISKMKIFLVQNRKDYINV